MEEEVILNKIIQDATDEANRILDEAKKKAHEIEEKYKQQISKKTDSEIDNIKREIKRNKETDIEKAELESRVVILEKKHEKIKAVKDEVKKKIKSLSVKELIDIYKKIISQYKNKNELEVLLPEKNKAEISKELAKIGISLVIPKKTNENSMIFF